MAENIYTRGSEWRKWDLHVHTPASIEQHYGGDKEEIWEEFIVDLENLPPEFSVIGINDYMFIDGYRKVLEYKNNGRLENIDLILPVIEFRLSIFGGHDSLSSINYHVIFSDKYDADYIQENFIDSLEVSTGSDSCRINSKDKLIEYGKKLKEAGIINGNPSDIKTGFNQARFDLDKIEEILDKYFKGNYLTAIGKSEWEDMRWDGSIVQKKQIINDQNFVFCASKTIEDYYKGRDSLKDGGVNYNLLHFSDAHYFSYDDSCDVNKLGKSFTWIKADPTFEGLKQIIYEPEERVFIGEIPEILNRVKDNEDKYIDRLELSQIDDYDGSKGIWFDNISIDFNPGLVALIGNKGNGKSAIADILGALGGSQRDKNDFSFLNNKKFHKGKISENFKGSIYWKNEENFAKNLSEAVGGSSIEKVRYLPQNYFNTITNEFEAREFRKVLEDVIFNYVDDTDRLGVYTFEDLIKKKKESIDGNIDDLKDKIRDINSKIVKKEKENSDFADTNENNTNYRKKIKENIESIQFKITTYKKELEVLPKEEDPNSVEQSKEKQDAMEKLKGYQAELEENGIEILKVNNDIKQKEIDRFELQDIKDYILKLEKDFNEYKKENVNKFTGLGIKIEDIIEFKISIDKVDEKIKIINDNIFELKYKVYDKSKIDNISDQKTQDEVRKSSLLIKKDSLKSEIKKITDGLTEKEKAFEKYKDDKKKLEDKIKQLRGDKDTKDTLEYFKGIDGYLNDKIDGDKTQIDKDIEELYEKRLSYSIEILNKKNEILKFYKELKRPVDGKIKGYDDILDDQSKINIDTNIRINNDFNKEFLSFINQARRGTFMGSSSGEDKLKDLYGSSDLSNGKDLKDLLNNIITSLNYLDNGSGGKEKMDIFNQISKLELFYNYLFSLDYIETGFDLKAGNKFLEQLSPGEKGTLLLIFYLIIDKETIPLIIDQPEDNLDNQSVFKMLAQFIREAKKRRQIIIVTHNPNLAVGADADQIIHVKIDKIGNMKFDFNSGSIENININNIIVDILEGTMKAFRKRELKYIEK